MTSLGTYGRHFEDVDLRGIGNASAKGMHSRCRLWERAIRLESDSSIEESTGVLPIQRPSQGSYGRAWAALRAEERFQAVSAISTSENSKNIELSNLLESTAHRPNQVLESAKLHSILAANVQTKVSTINQGSDESSMTSQDNEIGYEDVINKSKLETASTLVKLKELPDDAQCESAALVVLPQDTDLVSSTETTEHSGTRTIKEDDAEEAAEAVKSVASIESSVEKVEGWFTSTSVPAITNLSFSNSSRKPALKDSAYESHTDSISAVAAFALPVECISRDINIDECAIEVCRVSQNQNFVPFVGWGSSFRLPGDPTALTNKLLDIQIPVSGSIQNDFPLDETWAPPPGHQWAAGGSWQVQNDGVSCDTEGCTLI